MAEIKFFDKGYLSPGPITYVVIGARYRDKWVFVKNRKRAAYEMPAGHVEKGESPEEAAGRELSEESGALKFVYNCINTYSVSDDSGNTLWGRLYMAEVSELGNIIDTDEIEGLELLDSIPDNTSFPLVLTALFGKLTDSIKY